MAMYPINTPLEKWLTIWVFHEVERIVDAKSKAKERFKFSGMSPEQRRAAGLPTNREAAIAYIKQQCADRIEVDEVGNTWLR